MSQDERDWYEIQSDLSYNTMGEKGVEIWFSSLKKLKNYLKFADQPVPNEIDCFYDDPFEYRWTYGVVEKVFEGPMSINRVIFWFHTNFDKGHIKNVEILQKSPIHSKGIFNFTSLG